MSITHPALAVAVRRVPDYHRATVDALLPPAKDNVLWHGALEVLVQDLGEHGDSTIVRDNIGRLFVPPKQ